MRPFTSWHGLLVAALMLVPVLPGASVSAASAATVAGSIRTTPGDPIAGERFIVRGTVPPKRSRPVVLQQFRDGRWIRLAAKKTTKAGAYRFHQRAPQRVGARLRLRVYAKSVRLGGRRYGAIVTPDPTYRVRKLRGTLAAPAVVEVGQQLKVTATFLPMRPGRAVVLQKRVGESWEDVSRSREGERGRTTFATSTDREGKVSLRAVALARRGAKRAVSSASQTRAATWVSVAGMGGSHRCGIASSGDAVCAEMPRGRVRSPIGWDQVSGGFRYSCGVKVDGSGWCWGTNEYGKFGNGLDNDPFYSSKPDKVAGSGSWTAIEAGDIHTCGLQTDGSAWCWGNNRLGQLGNGSTHDGPHSVPMQVGTDDDWAAITLGYNFTCGLKHGGQLYCWGIGYGPTPAPVAAGIDQVSAGNEHVCAVSMEGAMTCWGSNTFGEQGQDLAADGWAKVSTGNHRTCAIRQEGSMWCWGIGPLGDGTTDGSAIPVQVGAGHRWIEVAAGNRSGDCGLRADGTAWCWGQEGDGTATRWLHPTRRYLY